MPKEGFAHRLVEAYKGTLQMKLNLENLMEAHLKDPFDGSPVDEIEPLDGATAWVEDGILRVTVEDYLPRNSFVNSAVRNSWLGMLVKALSGMDIRFKKALCVIMVYLPHEGWDVDNRGYGVIINALQYSRIIKDDTFQELAFMVAGDVDKDNPRTEIYVRELPATGTSYIRTILEVPLI